MSGHHLSGGTTQRTIVTVQAESLTLGSDLHLPFESLPIEAGSSTSLVTYLTEPGSPSHDALAELANWAGGHADQAGRTAPDDQRHLQ